MEDTSPKLQLQIGRTRGESCVKLDGKLILGVRRISLDIDGTNNLPLLRLVLEPSLTNLDLPTTFEAQVEIDFIPISDI